MLYSRKKPNYNYTPTWHCNSSTTFFECVRQKLTLSFIKRVGQCRVNAGPPSATLVQHWHDIEGHVHKMRTQSIYMYLTWTLREIKPMHQLTNGWDKKKYVWKDFFQLSYLMWVGFIYGNNYHFDYVVARIAGAIVSYTNMETLSLGHYSLMI